MLFVVVVVVVALVLLYPTSPSHPLTLSLTQTTLLKLLAGVTRFGQLKGDIRVNGTRPEKLRDLGAHCSYVPQYDDSAKMFHHLTVREALVLRCLLTCQDTDWKEFHRGIDWVS